MSVDVGSRMMSKFPKLSKLSTDQIEQSLRELAQVTQSKKPEQTVSITIEVPVTEIDFSDCSIEQVSDTTEAWGRVETHKGFEVDIDDATWMGKSIIWESPASWDIAADKFMEEKQ